MPPSVDSMPGHGHANPDGIYDDRRHLQEMMEGMSKFYLVQHEILNEAGWSAAMAGMASDPAAYDGLMDLAHNAGLHAHTSLPVTTKCLHFCLWETKASVPASKLQEFLDVTMTRGLCKNILHHIPMEKGPNGLPDPYFPMETARVLLCESEVKDGFRWLAEYQASKAAGVHREAGIFYEYAALDPTNANRAFVMHQFPSQRAMDAFLTKYKGKKFQELIKMAGVVQGSEKWYLGECHAQRSNTGNFMQFLKNMGDLTKPCSDEFAIVSFRTDDAQRFVKEWENNEKMGAHAACIWRAATTSIQDTTEVKCFFRFPQGARDPWLAAWWGSMQLCINTIGGVDNVATMHCQRFSLGGAATESTPLSMF